MTDDEQEIQKKLIRYITIESILGISLLIAGFFAKNLLSALSTLSLLSCIYFQYKLMTIPAYGIINLAYLSTSGVLFYFFAEIGPSPNFIFYGITGILIFNKIKVTDGVVLLILLMLLFAYANSLFNEYSTYKSIADHSSILNILFPVSLFIFIISSFNRPVHFHYMYLAIFWAIFISSIDFLLIYLNGPLYLDPDLEEVDKNIYTKISGISNHVNQLAVFIVYITPILLSEIKIYLNRYKMGYSLSLILLLILLLFMSSRAAVALLLVYFAYKLIFSSSINMSFKALATSALIGTYFAAIAFELPIIKKIQLKGDTGDEIRISKIDEALTVLAENPFFGVGMNNYVKYAGEHFNSSFNTHNTLLSVSAEQGLVGFVLFILIFIFPFINTYTNRRFFNEDQKLLNLAVLESCAIIFISFFTEHLHGNTVYYIFIATAIQSTLPFKNENI